MNDSHISTVLKAYVHDLKGSLSANAAFSRIILEEYGDKLDDKGVKWLSLMANEYALTDVKLTRLTQYAQLCNYQLQYGDCELKSMIDEIITRVISDSVNNVATNTSKFIDFQLSNVIIDYTNMPMITSDYYLLHLYFYEIISNTYQHALRQYERNIKNETDHIDSFHNINIAYDVESGCHQITYIEHNTILSQQDLQYIQQPLKTLHTSQSELTSAGLGFSILHRIAELLSGNVMVSIERVTGKVTQRQSDPGLSLVITLTLPAL